MVATQGGLAAKLVPRLRIALLGACLAMAVFSLFRTDRGLLSSDWTAFATGAELAVGPAPDQLYDRVAQRAVEVRITHGGSFPLKGQGGLLPFLSPPWVALLVAPFTALGLAWGARALILLQVAALYAGTRLALPRDRWAAGAVTASFPTLAMALNAQLDGLVVLGIGLAVAAQRRGWGGWAGAALGLTLLKPHLVVALAAGLVLARRRSPLAGWALAGLGLVAAIGLRDPRWLGEWASASGATVGRNGRELDPGTWAWFWGLPPRAATALTLAISLLVLAAVLLLAARQREPLRALAVLVAGGVLVAPHALGSDLTLVALAVALSGAARPWEWAALSGAAFVASVAPDPWPSLVAVALVAGVLLLMERRSRQGTVTGPRRVYHQPHAC